MESIWRENMPNSSQHNCSLSNTFLAAGVFTTLYILTLLLQLQFAQAFKTTCRRNPHGWVGTIKFYLMPICLSLRTTFTI